MAKNKINQRGTFSGIMVKGGLIGVALAASLGAMAGPAGAVTGQTATAPTVANVAVTEGITMTGLTNNFTLTGAPGATITGLDAVHVNVETNNAAGYTVTAQSRTATMLPAGGANTDTIPIAALTARDGGTANGYLGMSSTAPVLVHTQAGRSANTGDNLTTDFQIRIPVVNSDTYSATLDYVATSL